MLQRHFADNTNTRSVATRLRRERFRILLDLLEGFTPPVTLLDIGGDQRYWEMMLAGISLPVQPQVTLLNIQPEKVTLPGFQAVTGDGRAMPQFSDRQFDIVFSNSTIEHVGSFEDQKRMAAEVTRIGKKYYVQTPNRFFPIEPHFVFPLFQFLPVLLRAWLLQHFRLGWIAKEPDPGLARKAVTAIRLLSRTEFCQLFPEAALFEERFYGLAKSFVAYTK